MFINHVNKTQVQSEAEALAHVSNDQHSRFGLSELFSHKALPCLNGTFSSYYEISLLSNKRREADSLTPRYGTKVMLPNLNQETSQRAFIPT